MKINNTKKVILISSLLIITAVVIVLYIRKKNSSQPINGDTETYINLSPPSEEEKKSGDNKKQEIVNSQQSEEQKPASQSQKKVVSVIVTDAAQYDQTVEVRAFIPDILEQGKCKITFKNGGKEVSKNASAYPDASTTICTNPKIDRSEFQAAGEWSLTVHFESESASGNSIEQKVTIR